MADKFNVDIDEEAVKGESSGGKPAKSKNKKKKAAPKKAAPIDESSRKWSVLLFAAGILFLLLALIKGSAGWLRLHNIILGLFGAAVFFVPAVLIYTAVMIGRNTTSDDGAPRGIWRIILTFLISATIQIFFIGEIPGDGFRSSIVSLYRDGKDFYGGGVSSYLFAGPMFLIFGETGAKIVTVISYFVVGMMLTGKGLMDFLEFLSRPFKSIWNGIINLKDIVSGEGFEESFDYGMTDDEREKRRFDADLEAIELVNNRSVPANPVSGKKKGNGYENGFSIDVPVSQAVNKPEPAREETIYSPEANALPNELPQDNVDFCDENGEPLPKADSLDMLIANAAGAAAGEMADHDVIPYFDQPVEVTEEEQEFRTEPEKVYELPSIELLTPSSSKSNSAEATAEMHEKADIIVNTLGSFGVTVRISNIERGPSITRYEIQPGAGIKVSKIKGLEDDISLYLAAQGVRIEAPVPGKACVGIEVPNTNKDVVTLREILATPEFKNAKSKLTFAVGKDIAGKVILGDIAKMPHVIIAGTTGSGKSVCTRSIIMSILYNATPDEVKLILIDPKIVEFKIFDGIPHLLIPIVTEAKKAAGALNWAVNEMMRRYQMFAEDGANDIKSYNELAEQNPEVEKIPQIVIFIDELADMMLVAGKEVEDSICRLAQMGRAAGMHLVVATQRPTTDVITGLIKANIPSRIALSVMSQIDSRTIIDQAGADKLLGNGDMLYMPIGQNKPIRVQGCFASTKDIDNTIKFIKSQVQGEFDNDIIQAVESMIPVTKNDRDDSSDNGYATGSDEDYIERAMAVAVDNGQISTSMLQRKLKLGYARAARIMDELEEMGVVGPSEGAKPRKVLMSRMQLDERRARKLSE